MNIQPVILAGGSGTRLWPLSRKLFPKQFLKLLGQHTLLQQTIMRLHGITDIKDPIVVCNEEHQFLINENFDQIGKDLSFMILEPEGKNTAPALTIAALAINDHIDNEQIMLIMPSDHIISNVVEFQKYVLEGFNLAVKDKIVTFGINPTSPNTNYGYIKTGKQLSKDSNAFWISHFTEKPNPEDAERMIESNDFFWNSGIFMMKVSTWLNAIKNHRNDIATSCSSSYFNATKSKNIIKPDPTEFNLCPSESIDYAVMEHSTENTCVVLPIDVGWSDIGEWNAMWENGPKDKDGNIIKGDVYVDDVKNSLILSQSRLVSAVSVNNLAIVETPDAILISEMGNTQKVKEIVNKLIVENRIEPKSHKIVNRPWGSFETLFTKDNYKVKRLYIKPKGILSLQVHHHRHEHWTLVSGLAEVTLGNEKFQLHVNESLKIPLGTPHRIKNISNCPIELIEVQYGNYLGEDDIIRLEDNYDRITIH